MTLDFLKTISSEELEKLSFHEVEGLAFENVSFGADEQGIHGCTPPEILHIWYLGIVKTIMEYFFEYITSQSKIYLDNIVSTISERFSRQSNRNMPKLGMFINGTNQAKLTGKENGYQLFIVYLVMTMPSFKTEIIKTEKDSPQKWTKDPEDSKKRIYSSKLINNFEKYNKWLKLFETMLSIGEWLCSSTSQIIKSHLQDTIRVELIYQNCGNDEDNAAFVGNHDEQKKSSSDTSANLSKRMTQSTDKKEKYPYMKDHFLISKVEFSFRIFMKKLQKVVGKVDYEQHFRLPKFHQFIHIPIYIKKYASPLNIDGSRPEAIGKETAKYPGRQTQFRMSSFNSQASIRYFENTTIDVAYCVACCSNQYSSKFNYGWNEQYFTESYINNIEIKHQHDSDRTGINESQHNSSNKREQEGHSSSNVNTTSSSMMRSLSSSTIHYTLQLHSLSTVTTAKSIQLNDIIIMKTIMKGGSIYEITMKPSESMYFQTLIKFLYEMKFLSLKKIISGRLNFVESVSVKKNKNNYIYRCSHSFYGDKEWFDWVNVDWKKDGYDKTYPAKLLGIIDSEFFERNNSIDELHPIFPCGRYWAIIQTTNKEQRNNFNTSNLSTIYDMADEASIISFDQITCPAFVIPDVVENNKISSSGSSITLLESRQVISMSPKTKWPNLFMNHNEEHKIL